MKYPPTNLQVLRRPSRKKPAPGDIFAMGLPSGRYLFGRVIDADIQEFERAPMPGSYLIYVYDHQSDSKTPDMAALTPGRLLPPAFINKMPWSRGYFETVAHADLTPGDILRQYCFWDAAKAIYIDETSNPLPRETYPCGDWSLKSYRRLDDLISDALGIPRVAEDE